jgi:hypothetical protein
MIRDGLLRELSAPLLLETNYGGFHPAASRSVPGIDRVTGFLYAHRKIHQRRRVVSQTPTAGKDDANNRGLPRSAPCHVQIPLLFLLVLVEWCEPVAWNAKRIHVCDALFVT